LIEKEFRTMSAVPKPVYKKCSNCKMSYEHKNEYESLTPFVGIIETGKYSDHNLELRNCTCGTTLATYYPKDLPVDGKELWILDSKKKTRKKARTRGPGNPTLPKMKKKVG